MAALGFEEALHHFDAARSLLPRDERDARILGLRALALRGAARIDESLAAFAEALENAPDGPIRENLLYERSKLLLDLFRGGEAEEDLNVLLVHAIEAGDENRELDVLLALGRANYILSLDNPADYAEAARDAYEKAYERAKELGNKRAMAQALIPTTWFMDYWVDYRSQAIANLREAAALAAELDDEHLKIEARAAMMRTLTAEEQVREGEAVLEVLKARRDPLRLKEHYFWLMWLYWMRAELDRCVEVCDLGIELSDQLGSEPVQYPTIKALALMDLGRFDEAWASLQGEVADEAHRFGAAVKQLGIAVYLERVGAIDAAFDQAKETLKEAQALKRTWMQRWLVDLLEVLAARRGEDPPADFQGEYAPGFSASPIAGAERKLLEGDPESALQMAEDLAPKMGGVGMRNAKLQALVLSARALEKLGRTDDAALRATETLVELDEVGFRSLAWRLRALRARALAGTGDSAGADRERTKALEIVTAMGGTIPDPEHRAAFESDPVAAELLGGENA